MLLWCWEMEGRSLHFLLPQGIGNPAIHMTGSLRGSPSHLLSHPQLGSRSSPLPNFAFVPTLSVASWNHAPTSSVKPGLWQAHLQCHFCFLFHLLYPLGFQHQALGCSWTPSKKGLIRSVTDDWSSGLYQWELISLNFSFLICKMGIICSPPRIPEDVVMQCTSVPRTASHRVPSTSAQTSFLQQVYVPASYLMHPRGI